MPAWAPSRLSSTTTQSAGHGAAGGRRGAVDVGRRLRPRHILEAEDPVAEGLGQAQPRRASRPAPPGPNWRRRPPPARRRPPPAPRRRARHRPRARAAWRRRCVPREVVHPARRQRADPGLDHRQHVRRGEAEEGLPRLLGRDPPAPRGQVGGDDAVHQPLAVRQDAVAIEQHGGRAARQGKVTPIPSRAAVALACGQSPKAFGHCRPPAKLQSRPAAGPRRPAPGRAARR